MALTIKMLADGQIGPNPNTVYDLNSSTGVPDGKAWIVKNMRFCNTDKVAQTLNLCYVRSGSTPRQISAKDLSVAPGAMFIDDQELTLGAGDKLQAKTSPGSKFDYVISGVERDA